MELKNGAKVLASAATLNQCVVLAEWEGYQPFVTWQVDVDGNCFHGNYFRDLEDAEVDFKYRAGLLV